MFAAVALVLAAIGIYGVISYSVTQRTQEIGVRVALGAQQGDVLRLVLGEGAALAVAGVVIGVVGAFVATPLIRTWLFGIENTDPPTIVGDGRRHWCSLRSPRATCPRVARRESIRWWRCAQTSGSADA